MPRKVIEYTVLVSCPSDITKEKEIIEKVIGEFNRTHSHKYNIVFRCVDWKLDTFSSVGKDAQELINQQIVDDSDMAIALFWNKIGTATKNADSGTIEEIERLCSQNKQVFLYFSDCPISNKDLITSQIKKVKKVKKHFEDKSLYREYQTLPEFETQFSSDFNQYVTKVMRDSKIDTHFSDITITRSSLQSRIQEAHKSVFISGASLISTLTTSFSHCIDNKIDIKLLMTKERNDLIEECAKLSYTESSELLSHIQMTKKHFENNSILSPSFQIKCIDAVLPCAMVGIDIDEPYGKIYVQQYLYKSDPALVPNYLCVSGEKWYNVYATQIKTLWNDSQFIDFSNVENL